MSHIYITSPWQPCISNNLRREREGVKKEGESTMCWHVVLELSRELKQQEGKKRPYGIIEHFCWTINRSVEIFLKNSERTDLKGKISAKLKQVLTSVNEKVMN